MAILLWDLVIAAAFVLLAVGALAYVLVNLLLVGIKKGGGIVSAYDQTLSRRLLSRCDLAAYGRVRAHFARTVFRKLISLPWGHTRAPRKKHTS